jgi:hypothetical protein
MKTNGIYFRIICLLIVMSVFNGFLNSQTCFNAGTGADGVYHATSNTTLAGGVYNFTTFTIDPGVTVEVTGAQPLMVHCTGQVLINGTLAADGGDGQNGVTYSTYGIGGIGVAGGHNGGDGFFSASGGPFDGFDGDGQGGANTKGSQWSGGGGAGYANVGQGCGSSSGGFGGLVYGNIYVSDLFPGSGGGGGSGGVNCGSGGGGAGGGVIVVHSSISIVMNGTISCNGGNGGSDGGGNCGGGGGGSGGVIWLASPSITHNGLLSAVGGQGGSSNNIGSPYYGVGGDGAMGRIRLDYNGSLIGSGAITPVQGFESTIPAQQLTTVISSMLCYGDAAGYVVANCSGGIYPYTYVWAPVSGSDSLLSDVPAGIYHLTVTDDAWCWDTLSVVLTEEPQIDVSTSLNMITISANQTGASYQWLDCNLGFSVLSGETGQSYTPLQNGSYAVEVTVGECSDTSACVNITSVGIGSYFNSFVQVYPNPSDGHFTMYLPEDADVTIYDLSGKVIVSRKFLQGISNIDLREMSAGVYLMKIAGSMSVKTEMLIIQH